MIGDNDLLRIREVIREENTQSEDRMKEWVRENMVSKENYSEDKLNLSRKILGPLETKVYGLWAAISLLGILMTLLGIFK